MAGYNAKSKKSVALLFTNDKWADKEIREITPFTIATNNIKYLVVTQTKQVKNLFPLLWVFAFPDEFKNCSFHVFEELCWDFDWDCIGSIDYLW